MNKRAKSNTIRIIAGHWRGRRLPVLNSEGLRPTIDRVRETLFNWLMHDVAGARCLDLFAGTGVLGLECLSRGAAHVQFVESDQDISASLQANLVILNGEERAHLFTGSGLAFLKSPPTQPYDLVFLDPPFQAGLLDGAIALLQNHAWLAEHAFVYIEQASADLATTVPSTWSLHREQTVGQSHFRLYAV